MLGCFRSACAFRACARGSMRHLRHCVAALVSHSAPSRRCHPRAICVTTVEASHMLLPCATVLSSIMSFLRHSIPSVRTCKAIHRAPRLSPLPHSPTSDLLALHACMGMGVGPATALDGPNACSEPLVSGGVRSGVGGGGDSYCGRLRG